MQEDAEQRSVKRKIWLRSPLETFVLVQEFLPKQSLPSPLCVSRSELRRAGTRMEMLLVVSIWKVDVKSM